MFVSLHEEVFHEMHEFVLIHEMMFLSYKCFTIVMVFWCLLSFVPAGQTQKAETIIISHLPKALVLTHLLFFVQNHSLHH